jgi:hypothetical protein
VVGSGVVPYHRLKDGVGLPPTALVLNVTVMVVNPVFPDSSGVVGGFCIGVLGPRAFVEYGPPTADIKIPPAVCEKDAK